MKIWSCNFKDKDGNNVNGYATDDWINKHKSEVYNGLTLQSATLFDATFTLNIAQLLLKGIILDNTNNQNKASNEDKFLLDYIDYMQNKISMYEFAHKNDMTIMEAFNKLDEYKLVGGP